MFSLGVTWYALVVARLPFGSEPDYDNLRPLVFVPRRPSSKFIPLSPAFKDLLTQMLTYDWRKRITLEQVRQHPFFKGYDWDKAARCEQPPPFVPKKEDWKKSKEFQWVLMQRPCYDTIFSCFVRLQLSRSFTVQLSTLLQGGGHARTARGTR